MNINPNHLKLLVIQAKDGDNEALAELFSKYKKQLRAMIAFRMDQHLKGRVDPSDILQEAFLSLSQKLPEFRDKDMTFFVWLRLVTHESLINVHRRHLNVQKRDPRREISFHLRNMEATSISLAAHLLGNNTSVAGKAIRAEQRARLQAVLDGMEATDREIIALRIFEGLTNGEAAEVLGLTKQTTSKRFIRAIERLKEFVADMPGFSEN
jgi:RNA polymerase sigma-70 factor (ECF subfamily)